MRTQEKIKQAIKAAFDEAMMNVSAFYSEPHINHQFSQAYKNWTETAGREGFKLFVLSRALQILEESKRQTTERNGTERHLRPSGTDRILS